MRAVLLACLLAGAPRVAIADEAPAPTEPPVQPAPIQDTKESPPPPPDNYEKPTLKTPIRPREIVIDVPGTRTRQQKMILGGLLAAGGVAGVLGVYFHLDSRAAANDVSEPVFNGQTWTPERQARLEDGQASRTRAGIAYGLGGAFVIGAIVALIATEPKSEQAVIRPRHAGVTPIPGGAIAGAGWSF
jgi:hypothetical protein